MHVRVWHIATDRLLKADGRFRSEADMQMVVRGNHIDVIDPACVKTHTSEKCRKYNSLTRYRAVCAQYDLTLMMRNRSEIFLRAR